MPSAAQIEQHWKELFGDPMLSPENLKRQPKDSSGNLTGPPSLRSVLWRIWLAQLPLPVRQSSSSSSLAFPPAWMHYVSSERANYETLATQHLSKPDTGSPSQSQSPSLPKMQSVDPHVDPLSQEAGNPWQRYYEGQQLRSVIMQDVERTFPDRPFFRQEHVQLMLANILQVWSTLNEFGYRQGIHELLACILEAVSRDSIDPVPSSDGSSELLDVCHATLDARFVEHDSYALFRRLMSHTRHFYDPTPSHALPLSSSGRLEQPIVAQLHKIIHVQLATVDPLLTATFVELEIEPQLFGLRWLRMLFTREFPLGQALQLWDLLFAEDPTLQLAEFVVIAMLLRIRTQLIGAEYAVALQLLLRYPSPPQGNQYHMAVLFHQAKLLRDNPAPAAADIIRQQNVALGFISREEDTAATLAGTASPPGGSQHPPRPQQRLHRRGESAQIPFLNPSLRSDVNNAAAGLTDLARGVYARAESYGINRAIGDFRRSLQPPPSSSPPSVTSFRGEQGLQAGRHQQLRLSADYDALQARHDAVRGRNADCASAVGVCAAVLQQQSSVGSGSNQDVVAILRQVQRVLTAESGSEIDQATLQRLRAELPDPEPSISPAASPGFERESQSGTSAPSSGYLKGSRGVLDAPNNDDDGESYPPLKGLHRRSLAVPPASPLMGSTGSSGMPERRSPSSQVAMDPLGALG